MFGLWFVCLFDVMLMVCLLYFGGLIVDFDCGCLFVMLDVLDGLLVCNSGVLVLFLCFFKFICYLTW